MSSIDFVGPLARKSGTGRAPSAVAPRSNAGVARNTQLGWNVWIREPVVAQVVRKTVKVAINEMVGWLIVGQQYT